MVYLTDLRVRVQEVRPSSWTIRNGRWRPLGPEASGAKALVYRDPNVGAESPDLLTTGIMATIFKLGRQSRANVQARFLGRMEAPESRPRSASRSSRGWLR